MNNGQNCAVTSVQLRLRARLNADVRNPPPSIAGLRRAGTRANSLSATTKELVALAMAVGADNEHRIRCHVQSARRAGATRREITDTVAVAVLVGGETLTSAGNKALVALEQFERMPFYLEQTNHS